MTDEMKELWRTQEQKRAEALGSFVREDLAREFRRRRFLQRLRMAYAMAGSAALLAFVGWMLATHPPRGLAHGLALGALLVPALGLMAARLAAWRADWRISHGLGATLVETARGTLKALEQDLRSTRSVLIAQVATALILPIVLWTEVRSGLATPREALAQAGLLYGALTPVALVLINRWKSILTPRRTQLRELVESMSAPPDPGAAK
jgi:hypothetical protein